MGTKSFAEDVLSFAKRAEDGQDISGTELAQILKQITLLELEAGGPYAAFAGGAADIGMNLAIARFLKSCDVELPKLEAYLDATISKRKLERSILRKKQIDELLAWRKKAQTRKKVRRSRVLSREEERVIASIRDIASERFAHMSLELRESSVFAMERTMQANGDMQMSLMALYTKQALGRKASSIHLESLGRLGLANIFFWSAFVIYDDFWDVDEAADPKILPTANFFARHYTDFFSQLLPEKTGFRSFFHITMDKLDAANAWETAKCRARVENGIFTIPERLPQYGDFGIKFWPAGGHILGPVSMLVELGYPLNSREVKSFIAYFTNYLVAMQINDDLHDWKEDLARGHISTAVSVLLSRWNKKFPKRREIDLVSDMPALEEMFWFEVLRPMCDAALTRSYRAREALKAAGVFENIAPLERYIIRNEITAREALNEYQKSKDFIREFS